MKIKNLYAFILSALFPCLLLGDSTFSNSQGCSSLTNVAMNKTAYQVSTSSGGVANRAIDGITNGDFFASPPSVSQTNYETNGWWEVDLGDVYRIDNIEVWNQVGGNTLEQYYVFISEHPFISYDLPTVLTDTTIFKYHYDSNNYLVTNNVAVNSNGRYVRVQRNGGGFVTLAELKVNGCEISPIEVSPATCGVDNGSISFDENCSYLSYIWSDGSEDLNRTDLTAGGHSITITNKKGCKEELIFNVPDISSCNFSVAQNAIANDGMGSPCYEMALSAMTNGEDIPFSSLDISWQVGGTGMDTVFSSAMSIELPVETEWVEIDVALVLSSGEVSCCTYTQNYTINNADDCVGPSPFASEANGVVIFEKNKNVISLLEVSPNPFQENLKISFQSAIEGNGRIQMYDNLGNLIYDNEVYCTGELQHQQIRFGPDMVNGLYFIQVHYPNTEVRTAKVVYMEHK